MKEQIEAAILVLSAKITSGISSDEAIKCSQSMVNLATTLSIFESANFQRGETARQKAISNNPSGSILSRWAAAHRGLSSQR